MHDYICKFQLSPESQQQLLQLPANLVQQLISRAAARTIKRVFLWYGSTGAAEIIFLLLTKVIAKHWGIVTWICIAYVTMIDFLKLNISVSLCTFASSVGFRVIRIL